MAESLQHKLDRVRRPRVQITYDVETGGAMEKKELPFVVGVMADLSGQPKDTPKPMKDRKYVPIDRDNFNAVLEKAAPRLAMSVQNRLTDADTKLAVELNFKNLSDFEPAAVAEQVPALKELLDVRGKLNELLGKMEGNDKLNQLLGEVLSNAQQALQLAGDLGIDPKADGQTPSATPPADAPTSPAPSAN
jgi:type VI secretion system protein ImpB